MKKNNYRLITIYTYIVISILAATITFQYTITKEKELLSKEYEYFSKKIIDKIESLIDKKKNATLALTITLANNTEVVNILKNNNSLGNKLPELSQVLREETAFKNVWFQVINNEGISLYRSWSDKKNDELYKVRKDLRAMLKEPKIRSTISVGKYDITFKAMVPIYEDGKFSGIIESITHFNSISRGLRQTDNIEPLIIAEERFTEQLKFPFTGIFLDNHYVANLSANEEIMQYLKKLGVKESIKKEGYFLSENYLIVNHPIIYDNEKLATFVVFYDLKNIDKTSIDEYKMNSYLYLVLFILLLGLILFVISYYLYSKEITKLYNKLNVNQKELKKLNRSLKQTVDDEIAKNDKKNKIMFQQSKLAAMGEMIGNIAHQWRQPLSVITTAASGMRLKKEMGINNQEEELDSIDLIMDSAKYLSNTIDDFRYFFSPNKEKSYFDISDLIDKMMKLIEKEFGHKSIKIIKDIESREIKTYENELLQVLINLLNNSRDELEKTSGQDRYIFIKSFVQDNNLIVRVYDNAGGIPDDIIDRIFEPYFTTKHQSQGTGIGLYMSEEIITKHMNGEISVENISFSYEKNDYKGACFNIVLP